MKVRFPDHHLIKQELKNLADRALAQQPNIQSIYLFGSRARGNFSARSDADLLILLQDDSSHPIDRIPRYLELFQGAPVPIEIFPYTLKEAEYNAFARRALREAELLSRR